MRVISGKCKNKPLKTLEGLDTRPTTPRVKEAIFSIIQFDIAGSDILDLFSGCGQMGIESLSRDANSATLVDNSKDSIKIIRENVKSCNLEAIVIQEDYEKFVKYSKKQFDIIFLDPPYSTDIMNNSINLINSFKLLSKCGIIVCETSIHDVINLENTCFSIRKTYKYGQTLVTLIENKE